jgi:hypothetical protein
MINITCVLAIPLRKILQIILKLLIIVMLLGELLGVQFLILLQCLFQDDSLLFLRRLLSLLLAVFRLCRFDLFRRRFFVDLPLLSHLFYWAALCAVVHLARVFLFLKLVYTGCRVVY